MISSRYYDPEGGMFLQPADVSSLDPTLINGLNLYAYANDNPINTIYSNFNLIGRILPSLKSVITLLSNDINIHWKNQWFATGWPSFIVLSNKKFAVVDWKLSVYKGSLYFDALEIGYKGKYIDVSTQFGGAGFICGWENKKFRFRFDPLGAPGIEISIDFWKIIKDIFGW